MKKQTTFIAAILCFLPLGQPLIIKTGIFFSSAGLMVSFPEKLKAESANFYFKRGVEKKKAEDYYGAISDFTKAIELDSDYLDAYYNRGWLKISLGDDYGGIFDFTKVINLDSQDAEAFYMRGIAKENIGDLNGACFDYRKSSDLGYENAVEVVGDQC